MIDVRNLEYSYSRAKNQTLKSIEFSVNSGEIFGFLGPSGAGKSTTQKILTGLIKDYNGSVVVMGKEIREWSKNYYEKIGVSFELPNLYGKLTGKENLMLVSSLYDCRTANPLDLLSMVGLEENASLRVSQYSKGMKMRLNFIRAFIHNPDLIFLDEPTSGLDPVNAKNIKEIILRKKKEGKTIFLTTHNMTVADELCDRVAFIVDGEIKLIDSPNELKLKYGSHSVRVEYSSDENEAFKDFNLKDIGNNEDFISLLKKKKVKTIHTQEATLEDIFIKITGRTL
ncbi:ATP-binding cassette domain-containing protein [Brassicibacter mesophilus]|uniref:ABC transporter ATP-binding protein n=1 Tax=Brassicibacter mesophilus TaxID=745119 RepID=UPI003D263808